MNSDLELPFPNPEEGFKHVADMSPIELSVVASKKMINIFFKWKKMGKDSQGHKYNFEDHVESLSKALAVLEVERILTIDQKNAIIKHLGGDGTK